MRNTADVTGGKPIVVYQYISGVSAINPLVAFYDIHGRKREVFIFLSRTPHDRATAWQINPTCQILHTHTPLKLYPWRGSRDIPEISARCKKFEELDDPAVSALRRAIAEGKKRWSVIGWVTKNLLSRAPPCFGRHVKPLVPAAFAVVSTHQPALGLRGGLWPVLLMCNP
jgi:hypothetical protein